MKINLAKSAGFCSGVHLAVKKAMVAAVRSNGDVYMLGDIVHNEIVINDIDKAGVKVVKKISDIPRGATILIRAHGTIPEIYEQARKRKLKIIDATCPMVADIHEEAKKLERAGYRVGIIGDTRHDEVMGIAGEVKNPFILDSAETVMKLPHKIKKLGIVVQSTQSQARVHEVLQELVGRVEELHFIDTICQPTRRRQAEIMEIPRNNDVVIVIGSATSANTKRLVEISKNINSHTHRVLTAKELRPAWFKLVKTVGVTAGASTPAEAIKEVVTRLEKM